MAHDPAGEPRPRPVGLGRDGDLANGEAVHPRAQDRQDGRQQGERRRAGQADDDRPGDPDRAQDHELEQDQPEEPEQDRHGAEEDGPSGGRDGDPDRIRDLCLAARAFGHLLAEPAGHEQRVVHPESEAEERREVQHEDAHRGDLGDQEDRGQGDDDRRTADDERHARRHDGPEHHDQGERRQRQGDEFAPAKVRLGHGLDVAVERGATGELHLQARGLAQALAQDRQGFGRIVRRQVQEHDVVGGVAIGRDLARRQQVGHDTGHVRRGRDVADRGGCRQLELRRPGFEGGAAEDDDERARREVQLGLQEGLRAGRFQVVEDEPAGTQRAWDLGREWERGEEEQRPDAHDPPGAAHDEPAEAFEGVHVSGSGAPTSRMAAGAAWSATSWATTSVRPS